MPNPNYRRIQDWNLSILDIDRYTSIEAAFLLKENGKPFLSVRVLGREDIEIFSNCSLKDLPNIESQMSLEWNAIVDFRAFIEEVENLNIPEDGHVYFFTPFPGVSLETVVLPMTPKAYGLQVHLSHYVVMNQYQWCDSGTISVHIICKGDEFLSFLSGLESDLRSLLN